MIMSVIGYKSVKANFFAQPFYVAFRKDEIEEQIRRSLLGASSDEQKKMQYLDVYYFGTFDDSTGAFEIGVPEFVISTNEILGVVDEGNCCS